MGKKVKAEKFERINKSTTGACTSPGRCYHGRKS